MLRAVVQAAKETPGVVLLGHQKEAALAELYANAGAFVLPSSHEGQPIAVIEALGYGCPVILSDIPAHRELGIAAGQFFPAGDVAELAERLRAVFRDPPDRRQHIADRDRILRRHDWRLDRALDARCLSRRAAAPPCCRHSAGAAGLIDVVNSGGAASSVTSPRLRREVDARSASGEGAIDRASSW